MSEQMTAKRAQEDGCPQGAPVAPARRGSAVFVVAVVVGVLTFVIAIAIGVNAAQLRVADSRPMAGFPEVTAVSPPTAGAVPDSGGQPGAGSGSGQGTQLPRPDPAWVQRVAAATGIPSRALQAYAAAYLLVNGENPGCGLGWNTLAGIGAVESDHGRHGGSGLRDDGYPVHPIVGPVLDGNGVAAIPDTDGGKLDGDPTWDHAVGPMQFLPSTWRIWGTDGNGDGVADPQQIDDATLATARYLCASGPLTSVPGWRGAVMAYNHSDEYANNVAAAANLYAQQASG